MRKIIVSLLVVFTSGCSTIAFDPPPLDSDDPRLVAGPAYDCVAADGNRILICNVTLESGEQCVAIIGRGTNSVAAACPQ